MVLPLMNNVTPRGVTERAGSCSTFVGAGKVELFPSAMATRCAFHPG